MKICFPDYNLIYDIRDGLNEKISENDFHLLVGCVVNWKLCNFFNFGKPNIDEIIDNIIEEMKSATNGYFSGNEKELREVLNCCIKRELI